MLAAGQSIGQSRFPSVWNIMWISQYGSLKPVKSIMKDMHRQVFTTQKLQPIFLLDILESF